MTLTYFTARSTQVAHAFEWGKMLKCHLKEKTCRKWANRLKIYHSEKMYVFITMTPWPIKAKFEMNHL